MNPRNTALLALVAAVLAGFIYLYEIRGAEVRAEAEAESKRLFPGLEASAIATLTLQTSDDRTARLERAEGGWRLLEPVAFPADSGTLEGLASALAELSSEAVYDDPAPLADYGLDGEPVARFTAGDQEYGLRVGGKSPVGGNTYVAALGDERVYAVPSYRAHVVEKRLDELRDSRILVFEPDAVEELRASWPGGAVRLRKNQDAWRVVEPLATEADAGAVEDLLSELAFLRATGFLDDPPGDAQVGLDAPEFVVELTSPGEEGAEPVRRRLEIGATLDGKERAVRGRVGSALYRIPAERLDSLPRSVTAYRFRELTSFSAADAARFEIVFQDEGAAQSALVSGERGDAGWTTTPDPMAPGKASGLVARLARLEAEEIAAETMGPAELAGLGLAPPRVVLRVRAAGEEAGEGALLAEVQLGIGDPARGIAALTRDRETIYWLDYDLAQDVPLSLEAFRNRFVEVAAPEAEDPSDDPGGA